MNYKKQTKYHYCKYELNNRYFNLFKDECLFIKLNMLFIFIFIIFT